MSRFPAISGVLLALVLLVPVAGRAAPLRVEGTAPHVGPGEGGAPDVDADPLLATLPVTSDFTPDPTGRVLNRVVYGYLPYWVTDTTIRWAHLTHLSYFAAGIDAQGRLESSGTTRLASARYQQLKADAATAGKVLTITFTNFDKPEIGVLITTKRDTTIATIVDTVADSGAGGANIDFETVPAEGRVAFVEFMWALRTALNARVPGAHLTIATPMIDWSNAYDFAGLADATDGLMMMAYGCKWGGAGVAGPNTPLDSSGFWGRCSIENSITTYLAAMSETRKSKLIVGLPWYGHRWQTGTDQPGASTLATGTSLFANAAATLFDTHGMRWDETSQSPWTTWVDTGKTYQAWCDDPESFTRRLERLVSHDLGGLGIWALGYDGNDQRWWSAISQQFGVIPVTNVAPVAHAGEDVEGYTNDLVALDGTRSEDADGDRLTWDWTLVSGAPVDFDPTSPAPVFVPTSPGTYTFRLVVNDGTLDSPPDEVTVLVTDKPDAGPGGGGDAPSPCGCQSTVPGASLLAVLLRRRRIA